MSAERCAVRSWLYACCTAQAALGHLTLPRGGEWGEEVLNVPWHPEADRRFGEKKKKKGKQ